MFDVLDQRRSGFEGQPVSHPSLNRALGIGDRWVPLVRECDDAHLNFERIRTVKKTLKEDLARVPVEKGTTKTLTGVN